MKMYKVYFEGQLIGIETFSTEEVREINNCDDIRVELITDQKRGGHYDIFQEC